MKSTPDDPFGSIKALAQETQLLADRALVHYMPVVEKIISSNSQDVRHIEHILDGLFDFCFYKPVVELFRRLCRHYYFINAETAADYVLTYREMWDSEETSEES